MGTQFYTQKEIGYLLGISPKTVHRLIKDGEINAVRVGRQIRIPEDSLLGFLNKIGYPVPEEAPS